MTIYIPRKSKSLEEFVNSNYSFVSVFEVGKKNNGRKLEEDPSSNIALQSSHGVGEWEIKIIMRTSRMIEKSLSRIIQADANVDAEFDFSLFEKNDKECYNIIKKEMERRFLNMIKISSKEIDEYGYIHSTCNLTKPTDGVVKTLISLLNYNSIYIENINYTLTQYEYSCNITIKRSNENSKNSNFIILEISNDKRVILNLVPKVDIFFHSTFDNFFIEKSSSLFSALVILFNIENIEAFNSLKCCILRENNYDNLKTEKINQISNISKEIIKILNKYKEYTNFKQFIENQITDEYLKVLRSIDVQPTNTKIRKFNSISLQYTNIPFPFKSPTCDFLLNIDDGIFNNQFTFMYDLYESILFIILGNKNCLSKFGKTNFCPIKKTTTFTTSNNEEYNNDDNVQSDNEDSLFNIPLLTGENCNLQKSSLIYEIMGNDLELIARFASLGIIKSYQNSYPSSYQELDNFILHAIRLMRYFRLDLDLKLDRLNQIYGENEDFKTSDLELDDKTKTYLFKSIEHFRNVQTELFGTFTYSDRDLEGFIENCTLQNVNFRIYLHFEFLLLFLEVLIVYCAEKKYSKVNLLRHFGMAENIIRILNSIIPENDKYGNNDDEISKIIYGEFSKDEINNLFRNISLMASFFNDRQLFTNFTFNAPMLEYLLTNDH